MREVRDVCGIDMPSQCVAELAPVPIGTLTLISPAMASECALGSNENAIHASSAKASSARERRWSERRIRSEDNPAVGDPQPCGRTERQIAVSAAPTRDLRYLYSERLVFEGI